MKDKFVNIRATEKEKKQLAILAKKGKMSQAEFIRHSVFNKEIVVIDGLKPLQKELKRIGNNLNQLTTRSNMGHFSVVDLQETKDELRKIHESLSELCATKDELVFCETRSTYQSDVLNQCISTEDEIPKQDIVEQDNTNDERIVYPDICHEKSILNGFGRPKLNGIFGRNRGD